MKYLSTFSGIGGFELGIEKAYEDYFSNKKQMPEQEGLSYPRDSLYSTSKGDRKDWDKHPTCIGYSEIDKYAIQIYEKHFKHKNWGDITKIIASELPDFDLLVGGFPCQAFSIAGKRRGFDDTRGTLFFDIARILKEKRPRNFILENVKGLLSHDNGRTFATIINTLTELGYCVEWQVLNAKNFGVPQNRERVFVVGHLGGIPERKVFPITNDTGEITETIKRRKIKSSARGFGASGSLVDEKDITPTLTQSMGTGGNNVPMVKAIPVLTPDRLEKRQNGRRFKTDGEVAFTQTAQDRHGIFNGTRIRRLTPLECERLMGYPDNWTENGLSDTMEICVNINNVIENKLLELDTVSNITSDGKGMVFPICQLEQKENVNIVLEELVQEDGAINTINLGNAMVTLFNRKGILQNATELKENLIYGKMVEKSIYKLWKVKLVGHYEKEKLSTILTWINEIMMSITSISARTDESIIGVIIHWNESELNSLKKESLYLRVGNIKEISDTQRYKTLGNGIVSNVVAEVVKRIYG